MQPLSFTLYNLGGFDGAVYIASAFHPWNFELKSILWQRNESDNAMHKILDFPWNQSSALIISNENSEKQN